MYNSWRQRQIQVIRIPEHLYQPRVYGKPIDRCVILLWGCKRSKMPCILYLGLTQKWTSPCKKSCISSGILSCFSQADLGYWQLRSCQVIDEGSGFSIIPAIKRSRSRLIFQDVWACVFRPVSNFAFFQDVKVILQISISKSQWMSMANPVAVLKRVIAGLFLDDVCLSWENSRTMHLRPPPPSY
jgi:hypothetical protein